MRTIPTNIYRFHELSEKARERAKYEYASHFGYDRSDEAFASIKALAEHFRARISDWQISYFNDSPSSMKFEVPEEGLSRTEIRRLLAKLGSWDRKTLRGDGECKLTGYYLDEDAIDGFRRAFLKGESDLEKLLQAGFRTWLKAAQDDCEDFYTDKTFGEHSEANDYEYYEDGRFYGRGDKV